MLDEKKTLQLREILEGSARPLFLFHDDPDGSTSFLQLYRYKSEGKGVIVKTGPRIGVDFTRRVQEFGADRVFIMDIALVDQEFIQGAGAPVVWLDHHGLEEPHGSLYVNPRAWGETTPPCYMCYQITGKKDPWLAMIGCVGDWFMPPPDLIATFNAKYPGLITQECSLPEEFLFKTRVGDLVQMLSFNLKGTSHDAMDAIKVFSRLDGPQELIEESTPRARWLIKRYRKVKSLYDELKKEAIESLNNQKGSIGVFTSVKDRFAITKDLSNELSTLFPEKVLVVAREKNGEMKCSLRSHRSGPEIDKALEKAIVGLDAHGGGHEHACGANIKKEEFETFIENLGRELGF